MTLSLFHPILEGLGILSGTSNQWRLTVWHVSDVVGRT